MEKPTSKLDIIVTIGVMVFCAAMLAASFYKADVLPDWKWCLPFVLVVLGLGFYYVVLLCVGKRKNKLECLPLIVAVSLGGPLMIAVEYSSVRGVHDWIEIVILAIGMLVFGVYCFGPDMVEQENKQEDLSLIEISRILVDIFRRSIILLMPVLGWKLGGWKGGVFLFLISLGAYFIDRILKSTDKTPP